MYEREPFEDKELVGFGYQNGSQACFICATSKKQVAFPDMNDIYPGDVVIVTKSDNETSDPDLAIIFQLCYSRLIDPENEEVIFKV